MPEIEIRRLSGPELLETSRLLAAYAFQATPPLPDLQGWAGELAGLIEDSLHLTLFEDGRPVSQAAALPMTQQVRGHILQAGAVWFVATHPAARRKGYARLTMLRLLDEMRQAGFMVSCLYPFRESFYDRLGYTVFPRARKVTISPTPLLPLLKKKLDGEVELLMIKDGFPLYREYLVRQQQRSHGLALFSGQAGRMVQESNRQWLAVARQAGQPAGLMLYEIKGQEEDRLLQVYHFYYDNSPALYLLLEWLARHADQVKEIEIKLPPSELPETWLPDLDLRISSFEPPMARLLDVRAIGGLQTGPGAFSAAVSDPQCPWNNGGWQFETVDERLQVSPAPETECQLTIQGLTALLYGTHDPESFELRGWSNPGPESQAAMRRMFPRTLPYLHEVF